MPPSRLLTIYNCGTSFNRDKGTSLDPGTAGELVAHLYHQTVDLDLSVGRNDMPSYSYKMIFDGPGSQPGKYGKWETDSHGVRRPVEHPASDSKAQTPGLAPGAGGFAKATHIAAGLAMGKGWEDNVANAVQAVAGFKYPPEAINLIGWSRGAVTCHMIANALNGFSAKLKNIPINIFAVDPVPGTWNHAPDKVEVAGNVKKYRGVFAIHDRKIGFSPAVVKKKDGEQDFKFYAMPGVHDTVVQGATGLIAVAALVEHLAVEFLEGNGTFFTSVIHMTPQEICENYAIARKEMRDYKALAVKRPKGEEAQKGKPAGPQGLDKVGVGSRGQLPGGVPPGEQEVFTKLRQDYFVNSHHEEVFSKAFPQAYSTLFRPRPREAPVTAAERDGWYEFRLMKNRCRNSHEQLMTVLGPH